MPLFCLKRFGRYFDPHVLLHGDLARQTAPLARLALANVRAFGREDVASSGQHFHFALRASATSATSGRDKDPRIRKRTEQLATGRNVDRLLIVDRNRYIATGNQLRLGSKNHHHQRQHHQREHQDTEENFKHE